MSVGLTWDLVESLLGLCLSVRGFWALLGPDVGFACRSVVPVEGVLRRPRVGWGDVASSLLLLVALISVVSEGVGY